MSKLSLPRRQRLHLQIAAAMEQLYASALDQHAGDLAHHLYQAGAAADPKKTADYLALAADQALAASAFEIAGVFALLRDFDSAFAWLQKAYEQHDRSLLMLNVEPQFDPLHADPRFQDLARRIGIPSS